MSYTRINNNIAALNAMRNLNINGNRLNKSLERLSSGLRINRAADDAAGLAISEKIRNQVRGLNQAIRNAQDGISLIQTAEGGLNEVHNVLQRMRELAIQAANDTYTESDRQAIQDEIDQLMDEIDRITSTTEFNTRQLFDGTSGVQVAALSGSIAGAAGTPDTASGTLNLDGLTLATAAIASSTNASGGDLTAASTLASSSAVTINGYTFNFSTSDTIQDVVDAINAASGVTDVTASFDAGTDVLSLTQTTDGSAYGIEITNTSGEFASGGTGQLELAEGTSVGTDATLTADDSNPSAITAYTADGNDIEVTAGDFAGLTFTAVSAITTPDTSVVSVNNNAMTFQVGANEGQTLSVAVNAINATSLSVADLSVLSNEEASAAILAIDVAVNIVSDQRSALGAVQNRLESSIANMGVTAENLTAAESRIRDADIAAETMQYTRNQILVQAGASILAQANLAPQNILALLQ